MLDAVENTEATTEKPLKFRIIWGKHPEEGGSCVAEYEFNTRAEADAFWLGVEDSDGWDGFTLLEEGDVVPEDEYGCVTIGEDQEIIIFDKDGERVLRDVSYY